jgi:predicted GIY-YIG superfamily endonuclease
MIPPMHDHSYFTYIMASRSHTLYIGVTSCISHTGQVNNRKMLPSGTKEWKVSKPMRTSAYHNLSSSRASRFPPNTSFHCK